ncbi:hypothetical protein J3Q64DRAFT_1756754 [Phycomyces blakesleeanus]|uniref:Tetratricopeptide repeat protein 39B n=1 Tax=Phycomyces blakesleeanus TaxID=4837 RepID=A0ABR3ASW9_PHYBL
MPILAMDSKPAKPEHNLGGNKKTHVKPSLRSIARIGSSFTNLVNLAETEKSSLESLKEEDVKKKEMFDSIVQVRRAFDLFLDSRISEAETILTPHCETSMYHSLGYGFILFLKCMMTFEKDDINTTLQVLKKTINLASRERKKDAGWLDNITTWVKANGGLEYTKSLTCTQRHAELVYAEAYLLKALLGIVYDESMVSFLREGLNIRSSYNTYCTLEKYVLFVQQEAAKGKDVSAGYELDDHFTSGVALGVGCFNLILSMMPPSVVKLAEFVGFSFNRAHGMAMLESIGGWDTYRETKNESGSYSGSLPERQSSDEGLRRQLCDMVIILYHIVLSRMMPLENVDVNLAERVLAYNLEIYPNAVFFLYFNGRLLMSKQRLEDAKVQYHKAIDIQKDWRQLQHMCYWELGVIAFIQQDWSVAHKMFDILSKESNWSKAAYSYLKAVAFYMLTEEENKKDSKGLGDVKKLMKKVDGERKKIAGKSIPMEKFVSRKSRKFGLQNKLVLPDLEILHAFSAFDFMPIELLKIDLKRTQDALDKLETSEQYYHDDLCLVYYLRAVILRNIDQRLESDVSNEGENERVRVRADHARSIKTVFENAEKVKLDHYVYYFAHYEKAQMLMEENSLKEAEAEIQVVLKANDKGQYGVGSGQHAKSKYSLANALGFKCHNCLSKIQALASEQEKGQGK